MSLHQARLFRVIEVVQWPVPSFLLTLLLWVSAPTVVQAEPGQPALGEILQILTTNGTPAWINARQTNLPAYRDLAKHRAWLGVIDHSWPSGLVPIYAVERRGVTELRRRPPRGQENFVDPLFYALPTRSETNAAAIAGRWEVVATSSDGQRHQLIWELAVEGEQLAGRFDQNTEYRFAFIDGGTWRSNRLELSVDYVNEHFRLRGEISGAGLSGTWRRTDDSQSGTWTAERAATPFKSPGDDAELVDLSAWQAAGESVTWYGPAPPDNSGRWQPTGKPLCQVWHWRSPSDGRSP